MSAVSPLSAPAHEKIVLAKACEDAHLRTAMLRDSLRLLSQVTDKLNLPAVCLEYQTGERREGRGLAGG